MLPSLLFIIVEKCVILLSLFSEKQRFAERYTFSFTYSNAKYSKYFEMHFTKVQGWAVTRTAHSGPKWLRQSIDCFFSKQRHFNQQRKILHDWFPWINKLNKKLSSIDNTILYWFTLFILSLKHFPRILFPSEDNLFI